MGGLGRIVVNMNMLWCKLYDLPELRLVETAEMLNEYWPKPLKWRLRWLGQSSASEMSPTSYVLIDQSADCVAAHARLSSPTVSIGGVEELEKVSVVATSIFVKKSYRKKGIGTRVLKYLEEEAFEKGFGRIILWTKDACKFYSNNGFLECRPLKVTPVVIKKRLSGLQVGLLEKMLQLKNAARGGEVVNAAVEFDTGNGDNASDVWFSKRVREHFPNVLLEKRCLEATITKQAGRSKLVPGEAYFCKMIHVPFEKQIGPMCGISLLRCAQKYFKKAKVEGACTAETFLKSFPIPLGSTVYKSRMAGERNHLSILGEATSQRMTYDGEIFDIQALAKLASGDACGLDAIVFSPFSLGLIVQAIVHENPLFLCYDRGIAGEEEVSLCGGKHAHWGMVVGAMFPDSPKADVEVSYAWENADFSDLRKKKLMETAGDDLILVLQHTMSKKPVAVPFNQLKKSNQQLHESFLEIFSENHGQPIHPSHAYKLNWVGTKAPNLENAAMVCCRPPY